MSEYSLDRLIDCRVLDDQRGFSAPIQIICDIDKTYLETNFETLVDLAKIVFQDATDKITVKGASEFLKVIRWGELLGTRSDTSNTPYPRALHFVSSSPPQLRQTLDEKLKIDGLDWSSDTFKNQAYNIVAGRVDLLKNHVAYKTAAILRIISKSKEGAKFFFIGDNAEQDAFIFKGIDLYCCGVLNRSQYCDYLEGAQIERNIAEDIINSFQIAKDVSVEGIYIRRAPGYKMIERPELSSKVFAFKRYLDLALLFLENGLFDQVCIEKFILSMHNFHRLSPEVIRKTLKAHLKSFPNNCEISQVHSYINDENIIKTKTSDQPSADDAIKFSKIWLDDMKAYKQSKKS